MRGTVQVLRCDGQPDSRGFIWKPEGVMLPDGEVPVILEFAVGDLASYVGKAKLRMDAGVVLADLALLDARMADPARAVLYPIAGLGMTEVKEKVVTKAEVQYVALSIRRHIDLRIGTLLAQGVKP